MTNHIGREETQKKREDLIPELVLLPGGEEAEAFMIGDAAIYLGIQRVSLNQALNRLEKEGRPITIYTKAYGGVNRYILKRDLDEMRRVEPIKKQQQ